MPTTWILVANDAGARLYETEGFEKSFRTIRRFSHLEGRQKNAELSSDRPGRSFDSSGSQRHSMGEKFSPHIHEEEAFARELSDFLERKFGENNFQHLALIAPPHLLGELRQVLSTRLKKCIVAELHKDFPAYMEDKEVLEHIKADLKI